MALRYAGIQHSVTTTRGRVFTEVDDPAAASNILKRVFGIISFSVVEETSADLPAIASAAASAVDFGMNARFAIRATRTGTHDFTSQDVAIVAGQAVVDSVGAPVDLCHPLHEIFIEVRNERAFIFTEKKSGPGGLPYSSQGPAVAIIEDEEDIMSAWLIMRRGCRVIFVCPPSLKDKVCAIYPWRNIKVYTQIDNLTKYAEEIALRLSAEACIVGDKPIFKCLLPVFYPLLGYQSYREATT